MECVYKLYSLQADRRRLLLSRMVVGVDMLQNESIYLEEGTKTTQSD